MADTTQGNTDVQYLVLRAPALMALIAGLLIHSFIIGVNVSDWWKGRSVTAVDHIVTSLEISRMYIQFVNIFYLLLGTPFLSILNSYVCMVIIGTVYDGFYYANIWLTSLLSIIFCLKISNFHSRLFLYLRRIIVHRTGYLIVAPGLLFAVNTLMSMLLADTKVSNSGTYNTTTDKLFPDCHYINSIYLVTIGPFFSLVFCCISSVLLFSSLYHHTTKMKRSSNLSISLETYYSVMRFISLTFIYNTLYLIGYVATHLYYSLHCINFPWLHVVLDILLVLHSSYLIYRTAKLRSHMSKIIQYVIDYLFQRKHTEPRENIEVVTK